MYAALSGAEYSDEIDRLDIEINALITLSRQESQTNRLEIISNIRSRVASVFESSPKCMLTKLHKSFACFLLQYGEYESVLRELSGPLLRIHDAVLDSDILSFFYYRGLAQIKCERFEDARSSMLAVVAFPSIDYSVINMAALRKLCLLDLIQKGKLLPLPEWIERRNSINSRIWEEIRKGLSRQLIQDESCPDEFDQTTVCIPLYNAIARAFSTSDDPRELQSVITAHQDYLVAAKDFGLAKKVLLTKYCQTLRTVSLVYSTVEVSGIMNQLKIGRVDRLNDVITFFNGTSSLLAKIEGDYLLFEPQIIARSNQVSTTHIEDYLQFFRSQTRAELQSILSAKLFQ